MSNTRRVLFKRALILSAAALTMALSTTAMATPIFFTFSLDSASGTFDGTSFTAKSTTFVCSGDTSNITGGPYPALQSLNDMTCSVEVKGVVAGDLSGLFRVYQNQFGAAGMSVNSGQDRVNLGKQPHNVMAMAYTRREQAQLLQWTGQDTLTTGKVLIFTGTSPVTFFTNG